MIAFGDGQLWVGILNARIVRTARSVRVLAEAQEL